MRERADGTIVVQSMQLLVNQRFGSVLVGNFYCTFSHIFYT